MAEIIGEFAKQGFINIVGGCCGTTPAHIETIVDTIQVYSPRKAPLLNQVTRLSGLEPLNIDESSLFINSVLLLFLMNLYNSFFALIIPSGSLNPSRCAVPMFVITPCVGRAILQRKSISFS